MRPLLIGVLLIMGFGLTSAHAQNNPTAAETIDNLKLQLIQLEGQEEATKLRAQQLDEAMKPENIERSLAGYGSTRPEEVREQRRRQLAAERAIVTSQLEQLTQKRSQLESAISIAEVQAYQQSARGMIENYLGFSLPNTRWLVVMGILGTVFVLFVFTVLILKRRTAKRA